MDGHGEIHAWVDAGTIANPPSISAQHDLNWLATRVSARVTDQP
jgi:hypothetical protein